MIESRTHPPPVVLEYMNSLVGMFRVGGLSVDLTHHVMHALGSRMLGFTQEVFPTPTSPADPDEHAAMFEQVAARYPHIVEIATVGSHDEASAVGRGRADQFEFALDVLLDSNDSTSGPGTPPRPGAASAPPDRFLDEPHARLRAAVGPTRRMSGARAPKLVR